MIDFFSTAPRSGNAALGFSRRRIVGTNTQQKTQGEKKMDRFSEIVICSNEETIAEGVLPPDASPIDFEAVAASFVAAAANEIERHPRYPEHLGWHDDSNYCRWRVGTHYHAGETFAGKKYGYRGGLVVTHTINPPKWLCDLCDAANAAGFADAAKAAAAAKQEDLTHADVCETAGDLETAERLRTKWEGI